MLQYPLYTLLAFDSRQHALPVAWVITRTIAKQDVSKWMKALADRVHAADSGWRINGFIIDDAALEVDPIRQVELFIFAHSPLPAAMISGGHWLVYLSAGIFFAAPSFSVSGVFADHGRGAS